MQYSRLIHSILEESINAKKCGYDISAIFEEQQNGDIIRRLIVDIACDDRFKHMVQTSMEWRDMMQYRLEDLAETMLREDPSNEDKLREFVDDFLGRQSFEQLHQMIAIQGEQENEIKGQQSTDKISDVGIWVDGETPEEERLEELHFLKSLPPGLKRLAKKIGRIGQGTMNKAGKFLSASKSDIVGITIGNDLNSLLPSEVTTLACRQTQDIFFKNYAEKKLQVFASASSVPTNAIIHMDGPIIICLDTTGSMEGERVSIARDITAAVCIYAHRCRRKVLIVKYASYHTAFQVKNFRKDKEDLFKYLSKYSGGGNDEDSMFRWLFTEVLINEENFKSADVLCVSDFGWSPIELDTMTFISENKEKGMKFYGLDVDGNVRKHNMWGTGSDYGKPNGVIDEYWCWTGSDARLWQ